jgi:hypothetical protein
MWLMHVTPSRSLHRAEAEDGRVDATSCVGPCYYCFAVFFVLYHRGILIF